MGFVCCLFLTHAALNLSHHLGVKEIQIWRSVKSTALCDILLQMLNMWKDPFFLSVGTFPLTLL